MLKKIIVLSTLCLVFMLLWTMNTQAAENLVGLEGCVFEASSTYFADSDLAPDAFDGNTGTKWGSESVGNRPGDGTIDVDQWIQVTFPEPVVISEVYLLQETEWSNIFAYELLVKDGENWKSVYQKEYTEKFTDETIELETPATTNAFRVHVTKAGPNTSYGRESDHEKR